MKRIFVRALLAIFLMAMTNTFTFAGQEKKEKSCAGNCCGGERLAIADMQDHNQQKHEQIKKDTTVKKDNQKTATKYTCPMHPEVKSSTPGKCPKCKMNLVEANKENQQIETKYTCPMHPEVKSSTPGKCPKCKMDLVEVKKDTKSLPK